MEKDLICYRPDQKVVEMLFLNQSMPFGGGNCSVFLLSVSSSKEECIFGAVSPLKTGRLP